MWLPSGPHSVAAAPAATSPRVLRLNAELRAARVVNATTIEFSYQAAARAIAILDRPPQTVQVDGIPDPGQNGPTLLLPRGQHLVTVTALP